MGTNIILGLALYVVPVIISLYVSYLYLKRHIEYQEIKEDKIVNHYSTHSVLAYILHFVGAFVPLANFVIILSNVLYIYTHEKDFNCWLTKQI